MTFDEPKGAGTKYKVIDIIDDEYDFTNIKKPAGKPKVDAHKVLRFETRKLGKSKMQALLDQLSKR